MIEINLLPEELRKRAAPKVTMPEIPIKKTLIVVGSVVLALQLILSAFAIYQRAELASVIKENEILKQETALVAKEKKEIDEMKKRLNKIGSLTDRKYRWATLLESLVYSMTKGVWLTGLSTAEEKHHDKSKNDAAGGPSAEGRLVRVLRLEGSAVGQGQETAFVGKFIKELKENKVFSALFSDIELSRIEQKKMRDLDVYDFSLSCVFAADAGGASS